MNMKVKRAKLANAIKVGNKEVLFIQSETGPMSNSPYAYDIELIEGVFFKITEKRPSYPDQGPCTSYTTINNCVYWEADESVGDPKATASRKPKIQAA